MRIQCPGCQTLLELPQTTAKQVQCPRCRMLMAVPELPSSATSSREEPVSEPSRTNRPQRKPKKKRRQSSSPPWIVPTTVGVALVVAMIALIIVLVRSDKDLTRPKQAAGPGGIPRDFDPQGRVPNRALPNQDAPQAPEKHYFRLVSGSTRGSLARLEFSITFEIVENPRPDLYRLMIRSSRGTTFEANLTPLDLRESGTLEFEALHVFAQERGAAFTAWIETRVPGAMMGRAGQRVSNEVRLTSTQGPGGPPRLRP
ncbi:MAG TPA: hypothetical protein PKC45_18270 [Gemmatales bacterium]|nr:hypothetical protein [Gemmatales bacterium]